MILSTHSYICYAPGEFEALIAVSVKLLSYVTEASEVSAIDMDQFKQMLTTEAEEIEPTEDILKFGRRLYGSGLREYEAEIKIERIQDEIRFVTIDEEPA